MHPGMPCKVDGNDCGTLKAFWEIAPDQDINAWLMLNADGHETISAIVTHLCAEKNRLVHLDKYGGTFLVLDGGVVISNPVSLRTVGNVLDIRTTKTRRWWF